MRLGSLLTLLLRLPARMHNHLRMTPQRPTKSDKTLPTPARRLRAMAIKSLPTFPPRPPTKAIISEIQNADDWGLAADAFELPAAADLPATTEAQATDEVKLDLAILQYARFARGGRLSPSRISALLDQRPELRGSKTVLNEI